MEFNIVIVGGGSVGKSAITVQYTSRHFIEDYDPTIEDTYRIQKVVDNVVSFVNLRDTAGQEEYSCMTELCLRDAHGYLVVYSITNRISFDEVNKYFTKISQMRDVDISTTLNVPLVLFGNKNDLENERKVSTEEGMILAALNNAAFFEGSAKNRTFIDEAFNEILRRAIMESQQQQQKQKIKKEKKHKCTIL
eukprot:TRINITY_DN8880_c0_g1_i1.p1 TRINITY_DN8880_c0_g1~~TRINITY_DN8880_c0_g1_i1.p1  ORF type:complete len:193 (-),score=38.39 TRINITY_DN8880_c0_g1_i1:127-705(-)